MKRNERTQTKDTQGTQSRTAKAGKRGRTPDHLFKRGEVYWIRYSVAGKKIRKSLRTTSRREAIKLRDQILAQRRDYKLGLAPAPVPRPERTLADVLDLAVQSERARGVREGTLDRRIELVRNWIAPKLGAMPIADIKVEDVEAWLAHCRSAHTQYGKPMSPNTLHSVFHRLDYVLSFARKRGLIIANPCDLLDWKPKPGKPRERALSELEIAELLRGISTLPGREKARARVRAKTLVMLGAGLRWGEVHGLAWSNLDFDGAEITIVQQWDGRPLKSESSAATLPIPGELVQELLVWQRVSGLQVGPVFPSRIGGYCKAKSSNTHDRGKMAEASDRADIPRVIPHDLRHTYVTQIYESTADQIMAQRLARHASFSMTRRYIHDRRDLREAVDAINLIPGNIRGLRSV